MDILLRGGSVVDGTGGPTRHADVAIKGERIAAIGPDLDLNTRQVIDVDGMIVSPGFIDIHTHSDLSALRDPSCESRVRQGVTTEVTGNCGKSAFPVSPQWLESHRDQWAGAGLGRDGFDLDWIDLDGYVAAVHSRPTAVNLAPLVGHGTLRIAAMGLDRRAPTDRELTSMRQLLDDQLRQGAFGLSTGLTLVPGAYADEEEVLALVEVVAQHDALYATHTRGDRAGEFSGLEEAIRTAERARARLQYSHAAINVPKSWGRASEVTDRIMRARSGGLDVEFDVYPYDASSSAMTQYLPTWVQEGGTEAMRMRLADPLVRERALTELRSGWFGGIPWLWDRVLLSRVDEPDAWSVGLTIEEAAGRVGKEPAEWALQLCLDHGNAARVVLFYRTEEDMMTFLAHPLSVVGSDGYAMPFDTRGEQPHPRSFGTYPRVFGRYVREKEILSLEEAVRKCTGAVAKRLHMRDRGILDRGMVADVVVFDPDSVVDRATFSQPATPPDGIHHVLVNGELVVDSGRQTEARPGRVLRRSESPSRTP